MIQEFNRQNIKPLTLEDGPELSPATLAITAGRPPREPGAPVNEPVALTSTYLAGGERSYARIDNPSWEAFETAVDEWRALTARWLVGEAMDAASVPALQAAH